MRSGFFISPIAIFVLLGLALLGLALATWWRPRRGDIKGEPGCGACGYSTRGLTTFICPECGNDLRRVGIGTATPVSRGVVTFIVSALFFTFFLLVVSQMVTMMLLPLLPTAVNYSNTIRLTPASDARRQYDINCSGPTGKTAPVVITTTSPPGANPRRTITYDPATGGYTYQGNSNAVTQPTGFGPEAVLAWMSSNGIDTTKTKVVIEAARLAGLARKAGRVPQEELTHGYRSGTSSRGGGPIFTNFNESYSFLPTGRNPLLAVLPALWIVLWVVMIIVLWKSIGSTRNRATPSA